MALLRRWGALTKARAHTNRLSSRANAYAAAASSQVETVGAGGGRSSSASSVVKKQQSASEEKVKMIDLNPPRGTRDFLPAEMRVQKWLFSKFAQVSEMYGFDEIMAPVLENEALFTRKGGEEITQQLYNFTDKGDRPVSLRPELTPSLARIVLKQGKGAIYPLKYYAIGQCWRYERMTRGRRREHYQWNMDVVGVSDVSAEAELIAALVTFMQRVGLSDKDVGIKISTRSLLAEVLAAAGVPDDAFVPVCIAVDKLDKVGEEKVREELAAVGVPDSAATQILAALKVTSLEDMQELLGESTKALDELTELFRMLDARGMSDWLVFDPSVVRGLSYYTGVVFEGFDRKGELRAIFGGGRYDRLMSTYGGEDIPCAGFGFGDAVIMELLSERNLMPSDAEIRRVLGIPETIVVSATSEAMFDAAGTVAEKLRCRQADAADGVTRVDLVLEKKKKLKWIFKLCDRVAASTLYLVGEKEWADGQKVVKKDLATGEQEAIALDEL